MSKAGPTLGLSGHTHTTENLVVGTSYEGWEENTGLAEAPFHQIVTGAISGSWWTGDRNTDGVPHGTQRLGSPRGYYQLSFTGPQYVDTYHAFGKDGDEQLHASFNTPRFRAWSEKLLGYIKPLRCALRRGSPRHDQRPGRPVHDHADDLAGGTWVAVNVWNGSKESSVSVSVNGAAAFAGALIQPGEGEAKKKGENYADPLAIALQSTNSDMTIRSASGGDDTAGFRTWKGTELGRRRRPPRKLADDRQLGPSLARGPARNAAHRHPRHDGHHHRPLRPDVREGLHIRDRR